MAPFFGASTIVWANTIAIVLVALSLGYWLGGRFADRYTSRKALSGIILVAALLLAVIPLVARPFFALSVEALDQIEAGAFVGSLFAVLFLIAIPIVLLGTAAPWALRLSVKDLAQAGAVAGRLYAVSTLGSLVGTLLAALVLVPFVGTQRTFLVFAIALAVLAAGGLGWRWMAVPLLLAGALAIPVASVKAEAGETVLYEGESEHQYIRVVEQVDGDRALELNEGQATHSLWRPGSYLTDNVWDGYLVLPFAGLREPPRRVAILGNAAGTTARAYGHYFPATQIDGVEIDPELERVGRAYFDMGSNENLTVYAEDARPWLRRSAGGYDVIMVDAYRQPYIPFYLASREFFALARERLSPGGVLVVNAGHPEGNDDLERVLGRTLASEFSHVLRDPIELTNTLLIAGQAPISAARLRRVMPTLEARGLGPLARSVAERLEPRLPGGSVYTDDLAPVEWLIDRSILGYAGED